MKFIPSFLFVILLVSCGTLYKPTSINIPLHEEAGDFQISGNYGAAGAEIQLSGAFTDNFYLSGNFNYLRTKTKEDSIIKYRSMEYAIGYFKWLENTNDLKLDIALGYGLGNYNYHYLFETIPMQMRFHVSSDYHKWFIQPSIGRNDEELDMAFSIRLSFLHHYNFTDHYSNRSIDLRSMNPVGYLEPCYTLKVGVKGIKLIGQLGLVMPLTPKHPLSKAAYNFYGSIGFNVKLNLRNGKNIFFDF